MIRFAIQNKESFCFKNGKNLSPNKDLAIFLIENGEKGYKL
jgi:hypothetical protein